MTSTRGLRLFLLIAVLIAIGWLALFFTAEEGEAPGPVGDGGEGAETLLAVLDVGQGDSIFVRSPSGQTMLVDAGNGRSDAEEVILPYLSRLGISRLDYLVLSHPDQDHVGGMPALLEGVEVGSFVDSVQPGVTNRAYGETLRAVRDSDIRAIRARSGATTLDLGPHLQTQVLAPSDPLITSGDSESNNNSVVLRLVHGSVATLLTGDIEEEAEERVLSSEAEVRSQILKVAHHGSRYSTSHEFLDAVQPEIALVSAGEGNSYGHPHRELVERLAERGVELYRTDQGGTIEVRIDGETFTVEPEKPGR